MDMKTQLSLYATLCREETLYEAWKAVKGKNSAGDNVSRLA